LQQVQHIADGDERFQVLLAQAMRKRRSTCETMLTTSTESRFRSVRRFLASSMFA